MAAARPPWRSPGSDGPGVESVGTLSQRPRRRPKRILLLALHPGYVRNYERTILLLLAEGHEVHVAVVNPAKRPADRFAERLANEYLNLSFSQAPKSPRSNVDCLRRALRGLADYMRYSIRASRTRRRCASARRRSCSSDATACCPPSRSRCTCRRSDASATPATPTRRRHGRCDWPTAWRRPLAQRAGCARWRPTCSW